MRKYKVTFVIKEVQYEVEASNMNEATDKAFAQYTESTPPQRVITERKYGNET